MIRSFGLPEFLFLLGAIPWTLLVTLITCVAGGILGFLVAMMRISRNRALRWIAIAYIQILQGTPVLMMLFLSYYGLALYGFDVPPLLAASIAMSLFGSAYFADIWRGSLESVPAPQWEAAESLALTPTDTFFLVIVPQAIRISIPPTVGFIVQIVKNSSITALIGFVELTRASQLMNNVTFQPFQVFLTVAAIYFVICYPISLVSKVLERRQHARS
jgi:polar amino acid transport system permease protein